MRIGYCSPFNPMKSGISDFSEELVFALAEHMEIVIFSPVQPDCATLKQQFEVHLLAELDNDALRESLDLLVYHVGNNIQYHGEIVEKLHQYPGILELHELGLHHLAAAQTLEKRGKPAYLDLVEYCHGQRGRAIAEDFFAANSGAPWNEHALDLCMARPVIEAAIGVIVHSEMVKQMVLGIRPEVPIVSILHHSLDIIEDVQQLRAACRKSLDFTEKQVVFGAFGFATKAKRILPILDALEQLHIGSNVDYKFLIVGEVAEELKISEAIRKRGLENRVTVTGFTSLELFKTYMGACDFCLNLRYPTQGESSGSLHRMFGMGIPAIVTDVGTFGDFPEDVVIKVRYDEHEVQDICEALRLLITNPVEVKRRGMAAKAFVAEHCDLSKNAEGYADFFRQMVNHSWQPEYEDAMIGRLCELGLTSEAYIKHLWDAVGSLNGAKPGENKVSIQQI